MEGKGMQGYKAQIVIAAYYSIFFKKHEAKFILSTTSVEPV